MNKPQVFIFTFLCYTSIHALRSSYSSAKEDIANHIEIDIKFMGIVDALMLTFLGLGHFLHALYPIKKPVKTLWIAMLICGVNYGLIPVFLLTHLNIYVLSVLMCFNGFLQSYTWPNLLMIINSKFNSQKNSILLGFWSANANFGNIIGFLIFQILTVANSSRPEQQRFSVSIIGLSICSFYALVNGLYILARFQQLPIAGAKQIRQKSMMVYQKKFRQTKNRLLQESNQKIISVNFLQDQIGSEVKSSSNSRSSKSIKSAQALFDAKSLSSFSRKSVNTLKTLNDRISRGTIKSIRLVEQPQKVAQTPLSIIEVFKDPNIVLLTITFSLAKSVIYGIMLWLPLYFRSREDLISYANQIPITYDIAAIFGSVGIGYLFKKILNKGLLMIPFMIVLFICFFLLKFVDAGVVGYFIIISIVGFSLGGIFNTLSGLVVMELTKVIPENLKTSSLGFYSALTMAVGNITTAITQIIIGFVIGKKNQESIFLVFMIYAAVCLVCLVLIAIITRKQSGQLSKGEVVVIEEVKQNDDQNASDGYEVPTPDFLNMSQQKIASVHKSIKKP